MILAIGGMAVGHCTSHSLTFTSETKERMVKPVKTAPITKALFKDKSVIGLSYTGSAEGLVFYNESEYGYSDLLAAWKAGESVTISCFEREKDTSPYLKGACVLTSIEMTAPAGDDTTYSVNFENDGAPEVLDQTKITKTPEAAS